MTNSERTKDSVVLMLGGAGFLLLAGGFLWRDLALPAEAVLLVAALAALVATLLQFPRRWPLVTPAAVLATALASGGWFLAAKDPMLLPALAMTLVTAVVAVVQLEHSERWPTSPLPGRLVWYGAGAAFLTTSWAFYFHCLTTGIAADSVARRLVPTIVWLAVGLALFVAARSRGARAAVEVGGGLVTVALLKALAYDTTHLGGLPRVAVLGAVGALLLVGGGTLHRTPEAPDTAPTAGAGSKVAS